jgi:hypothetical protein
VKVRPGAVLRGLGVAGACLASSPTMRTNALFAGYAAGWPLNRPGLQLFVVVPDSDEPWKRASIPFATSLASWSAVMLVATTAVRRTRLPAPVAAVLLGGGVLCIDSVLADLVEQRQARAAAAAAAPEEADPEIS